MFELSHILTALDASDSSLAALEIAELLAKSYKATLHSTHVVPRMSAVFQRVLFPYAAMGEDLTEFEHEMVTVARAEIRRFVENGAEEKSPHPMSVLCAEVTDGLMRDIERVGPDLVVMGDQSGDYLAGKLGSNCRAMLNRWSGPLLISRPSLTSQPIQTVAAVTDFSSGCEALFITAFGLGVALGAQMQTVCVIPDPRLMDRGDLLRGIMKVEARTFSSKGKKAAEKHFERIMKALPVPFPQRSSNTRHKDDLVVPFGDPVEMIREYAGEVDGLLLVVGRKHPESPGQNRLGRTTEGILEQVPAHVLVVTLPAPADFTRSTAPQ